MYHSEQKCAHFCSEWCIVGLVWDGALNMRLVCWRFPFSNMKCKDNFVQLGKISCMMTMMTWYDQTLTNIPQVPFSKAASDHAEQNLSQSTELLYVTARSYPMREWERVIKFNSPMRDDVTYPSKVLAKERFLHTRECLSQWENMLYVWVWP